VIKEGGYFGERALLLNEQRASTVTAKIFCKFARLDRHTFTRLFKPVIP
jgi:CRP-like cAMP-binding protein